jgi:hypothetical protein
MRLLKLTVLLGALLLSAASLTAQQNNPPLTNSDVVKMVKAGTPDANIVNAIATRDTQFDLSATGLQTLNQAGVSSKVVRAMLAAESKKKDAAAAAENSTPAQDATATQGSASDASSGMGPQGMSPQGMPQGMSPDQMQQMMANMPPEMRERMQASMAQRNARRSGGGGRRISSLCELHSISRWRAGSLGQRTLLIIHAAESPARLSHGDDDAD